MSAAVARKKCDLSSFQGAQDVGIRRRAEWRFLRDLADVGQSGHRVQTATADDSNFCLRQGSLSLDYLRRTVIIQKRMRTALTTEDTEDTEKDQNQKFLRGALCLLWLSAFVYGALVGRTAWRNCSVIAGSRLSVTSTVSAFTSITTAPPSVCQV